MAVHIGVAARLVPALEHKVSGVVARSGLVACRTRRQSRESGSLACFEDLVLRVIGLFQHTSIRTVVAQEEDGADHGDQVQWQSEQVADHVVHAQFGQGPREDAAELARVVGLLHHWAALFDKRNVALLDKDLRGTSVWGRWGVGCRALGSRSRRNGKGVR